METKRFKMSMRSRLGWLFVAISLAITGLALLVGGFRVSSKAPEYTREYRKNRIDHPLEQAGSMVYLLGSLCIASAALSAGKFYTSLGTSHIELTNEAFVWVLGKKTTTIPWDEVRDVSESDAMLAIVTKDARTEVPREYQNFEELVLVTKQLGCKD